MNKKSYLVPEIKIRKLRLDTILTGSIHDIGGGDDGPGYGGGAQAPPTPLVEEAHGRINPEKALTAAGKTNCQIINY